MVQSITYQDSFGIYWKYGSKAGHRDTHLESQTEKDKAGKAQVWANAGLAIT